MKVQYPAKVFLTFKHFYILPQTLEYLTGGLCDTPEQVECVWMEGSVFLSVVFWVALFVDVSVALQPLEPFVNNIDDIIVSDNELEGAEKGVCSLEEEAKSALRGNKRYCSDLFNNKRPVSHF